jgi:putative glutamine amidotransferase
MFWQKSLAKFVLKIGMSDCGEKDINYEKYLERVPDSEIIVLTKKNVEELENCDGLVLTGGVDVAPELYGDWPDETVRVDSERDGAEFRMIDIALKKEIPTLGICRGLQILNVYFGGTLIIDLEKFHGRNHKAISDDEDRFHRIKLVEDSNLRGFIKQEDGTVNSSHHQAADRIGNGLKVVARADDGTVEAVESNSGTSIVAVQWHPERMSFDNPFSSGVLDLFNSNLKKIHNTENNVQWRLQNE